MEWPEVLKRIDAGESRTTEFKREIGRDLSAVGKALCAFANGEGGLIVLGVEDSGAVVGLADDPHEAHERLTDFLQTGCNQPVSARCERSEFGDGWVHWIEVPRMRGYEPLRYGGRCYIRRERSSVEPSPSELQELNNAFGFVLTEEQVILGAGVRDIDVQAFRSFQRAQGFDTEDEEQPSIEDDLRNAGIIDLFDGALRPTLYGLTVFGEAPQAHRRTGNFLIRCAAYAGEDQGADVFLAAEGDGRLDQQVQRALDWIKIFGRTETYTGVFREESAADTRTGDPRSAGQRRCPPRLRDYRIAGAAGGCSTTVSPSRVLARCPITCRWTPFARAAARARVTKSWRTR